jgi:hypothetical protein
MYSANSHYIISAVILVLIIIAIIAISQKKKEDESKYKEMAKSNIMTKLNGHIKKIDCEKLAELVSIYTIKISVKKITPPTDPIILRKMYALLDNLYQFIIRNPSYLETDKHLAYKYVGDKGKATHYNYAEIERAIDIKAQLLNDGDIMHHGSLRKPIERCDSNSMHGDEELEIDALNENPRTRVDIIYYLYKYLLIILAMAQEGICDCGMIDFDIIDEIIKLTMAGDAATPHMPEKGDPFITQRNNEIPEYGPIVLSGGPNCTVSGEEIVSRPTTTIECERNSAILPSYAASGVERSELFRDENGRVLGAKHYEDMVLLNT